jgi:putative membrane protein
VPFLVWVLLAWLVNMAALAVADWIFDGFAIDGFWTLVFAGAIFGIINTIVKPIVALVTLPFIILTLGILYFFINMGVLWLTQLIVPDFDISGFWTYVGATIVVGVVNWALGSLLRTRE